MNMHENGKSCRAFLGLLVLFILLFSPFKLFAESKIPEVKLSLNPLDLTRTPTNEELMAAGQLGGQLHPTHELSDKSKEDKINLDFGHAIQEWNKHNYKEAVKMFKQHVKDYPDSPWAAEADLHIGCDATYNGRYTEAEEIFTRLIDENKSRAHFGATMLLNKARQRLAIVKVSQGNFTEASQLFAELKKESPDWRHRTYASHWIQRISRYKSDELALLNCGTQALAQILKKDGRTAEAIEIMEMVPDSLTGYSIKDIKAIAEKYGYKVEGLKLSPADIDDIPLPAIVQINAKNEGDKGHYWVLEKIKGDELMLFDPQSGSRYYQSTEELSNEWSGNALVFSSGKDFPGAKLTENEMEKAYGACCGMPSPEDDMGDPDDKPDKCGQGEPVWEINKINMNLFVTDIPIWYDPPIGPPVKIQLSYNSQSAIAQNEPFGNKWQFNYGSYLVVDTSGNVLIFMPDGRRDRFVPDGSGGYTKPVGVFNALTQTGANRFSLKLLDDTVYTYDIPSGTSSLQPFLVEISDVYGQRLAFGYNSNVQISTITDALNRVTTLFDDNSDGLIDRVDDPFGRSAYFEYYSNGDLKKVTDMGGYWTEFSYDQDVYLTKIENVKGRWDFYIEPADHLNNSSNKYPEPGARMWEDYRITITNPLGGKEEHYYYGFTGDYSWYISPRDYMPYVDSTNNNLIAKKTLYEFNNVGEKGNISKISYPEGGYERIQNYDTVTGLPTTFLDYHYHGYIFTYNSNGLTTSLKDAKNKTTTINYYSNNIDVDTIVNGLGTIKYTYVGGTHNIESVTDRLTIRTLYGYNSFGQLTSITEAEGTAVQKMTELIYDPVTHNLSEIKSGTNTVKSFTYDTVGRVRTVTDDTGLTLTYEYNDLNQVIRILYPDTVYSSGTPVSKFVTINRSSCCPHIIDGIIDRAGLATTYVYDALKRLRQVQGPSGTVMYDYDSNGNLVKLTDIDKKTTTFEYDLDNRLVKKIFADVKFASYTYDKAGLLTKAVNARNIETNYTSYDPNHNLLRINYSDSTPDVTFTYYDFSNLLKTRTDGTGLYQYSYDSNGKLTGIDGPWANDTITFQYNELTQLKNMVPQGGQTVNFSYDYDSGFSDPDIGRLKAVQTGANAYTYDYSGVNHLVQKLTRPNGSYTDYVYNDPLKRLTEIINKTSSGGIIDRHAFTYNNLDVIDTETIETGTALDPFTAGLTTYNYNNLNQLMDSTNPNQAFTYDDDGNMTQGFTPNGYQFTATYDAESRLKTLQYTDTSMTPNIVRRAEYFYSGDSLLAQVKKFDNGVLTNDTRFVRAGFLPIQERDGSNAVTREYTWGMDMGGGIGGLLNLRQGGQDYSYLYDGKGNVMALIDGNQQVVASYRYDEFGKLLKKTSSLDQPYRFSTKQYDEETGLSYYGYRFYSPAIGRWMTRDPLGEAGGINLYGFVGNNPVNRIDPTGLVAVPVAVGACMANPACASAVLTGGAATAAALSKLIETIGVPSEPMQVPDLSNTPEACRLWYERCKAEADRAECGEVKRTAKKALCWAKFLLCLTGTGL